MYIQVVRGLTIALVLFVAATVDAQDDVDPLAELAALGDAIAETGPEGGGSIRAKRDVDPEVAKRSGLLHDIGKVLDEEHEGSHAVAGAFFLKRLGSEDPRVINAVAAHHGEVPAESPYVGLVMIADSVSAMRPGVRGDSLDGYLQRVRSLEAIASSIDGVKEAYAIQAGREIRVIVCPQTVSEADAGVMARNIRRKIEDELQYPGTIKVTVVRECRFEETAR